LLPFLLVVLLLPLVVPLLVVLLPLLRRLRLRRRRRRPRRSPTTTWDSVSSTKRKAWKHGRIDGSIGLWNHGRARRGIYGLRKVEVLDFSTGV